VKLTKHKGKYIVYDSNGRVVVICRERLIALSFIGEVKSE
jgi:hypothetical protein